MHAGCYLRRRLLLPSANPIYSQLGLHRSTRSRISVSQSLTWSNPPRPRPFSTSPFSPDREPRKALSFWTVTFTLFLLGGGVWIQDKYSNPEKQSHTSLDSLSPPRPSLDTSNMTTAEATPPGTVGNLTQEQEAKLRELWVLTAKVCGIKSDALEKTTSNAQNGDAAPTSPAPKKTKKKYGWFGRAYEEPDDSASVTSANGAASSIANLSLNDGDDKYGQSKEFQQALSDMTPEEIRTALWNMVKHDNPDALLLRFLRARKWDVKKALVMFISTIRWRLLDVKVDDDIMKNGEALANKQLESSDPGQKKAGEEFLAQMRMGKSFIHGVDKSGRPICVVRVRLHKSGDQSDKVLERFTVFTIESARLMLVEPVETAVSIPYRIRRLNLTKTDHHLRHDKLHTGEYGLYPREIHDQVLRSQLPRMSRNRPHPQSPMDLLRSVFTLLLTRKQ